MENEPELIRDQMQETRTALTEKLEALEQKVTNTVESTTSTVTDTVQNLTDAVQETVDTVKDSVQATVDTVSGTVDKTVEAVKHTFDITGHVERHPWAMLFGSVAAGFVLGRMLPSGRSSASHHAVSAAPKGWPEAMTQSSSEPRGHNGVHSADEREEEKKNEGSHEGIAGNFLNALGGEVDKLKDLGVSAVFGVLRDLVAKSIPGELGSRLKEWVNGLTEKMGAQPLTEPILSTEQDEEEEKKPGEEKPSQDQPAKGAPSQQGQRNLSSPQRR